MEQRPGTFRDFVRGAFAEQIERVRLLHAGRARWRHRLAARRPVSGAEQRWEDEGGRTR